LPDISKINNVAVADISKLDSITFADGQKVNNQSVSLITDAHTLISTHDIAVIGASSNIDITSGLNSTYDVYEFHFINIHIDGTGLPYLGFQVNADGGSGFNEAIQSSYIITQHTENNSTSGLEYATYEDQDVTDGEYQELFHGMDDESDETVSGILTLYAPSSGTYVKHYVSRFGGPHHNVATGYQMETYGAGYISTGTAIDEISFKMSAGNIDAGVIKMYGITK
jgi:hypothetical protein